MKLIYYKKEHLIDAPLNQNQLYLTIFTLVYYFLTIFLHKESKI